MGQRLPYGPVDDGTNPPVVVAIEQRWQFLRRGATVEYLRAP